MKASQFERKEKNRKKNNREYVVVNSKTKMLLVLVEVETKVAKIFGRLLTRKLKMSIKDLRNENVFIFGIRSAVINKSGHPHVNDEIDVR